jgi:hypothetical protein
LELKANNYKYRTQSHTKTGFKRYIISKKREKKCVVLWISGRKIILFFSLVRERKKNVYFNFKYFSYQLKEREREKRYSAIYTYSWIIVNWEMNINATYRLKYEINKKIKFFFSVLALQYYRKKRQIKNRFFFF